MSDQIRTAEGLARELAAAASSTALNEWCWQVFGYQDRPRRGAIFNRFVNADKLARENFLLREFMLAPIPAWTAVVRFAETTQREVTARIVELLMTSQGVPQALRFDDYSSALRYFGNGIAAYSRRSRDDYPAVFLERATRELSQAFEQVWIIGAARFFSEPGNPISTVESYLRREVVDPPTGKVSITASTLTEVFERAADAERG